jgi:hypothetical protein
VQCLFLRILGSDLSDNWGAETSPSSGYNHMHRHLLSGSTGKKKENVHMAIFSLGIVTISNLTKFIFSK